MKIKLRLAGLFALLASPLLHASGVIPDTQIVIINEVTHDGSINIKNTDEAPLLLYSTVTDLTDDPGTHVVAAQPVARLEPGQTQRVRFILTSHDKLDREHLKRVSFEGIPTRHHPHDLVLVSRQVLPMLIVPKDMKARPQPINDLIWSAKNGVLTVTNTGLQVVRLEQQALLMPGKVSVSLMKTYVLPGETLSVNGNYAKHLKHQSQVMVIPLSREGKTTTPQLFDLKR